MKRDLRKYREWKAELDRMKISQVVGCLLVESKVLKSQLVPVIARTTDDIKALLLEMARAKCKQARTPTLSRQLLSSRFAAVILL